MKVTGHLLKPTIGIGAGEAAKQGAIAAALGVVLTPLAALIALVDPRLAKDENCAVLISETENAPYAPKSVPADQPANVR